MANTKAQSLQKEYEPLTENEAQVALKRAEDWDIEVEEAVLTVKFERIGPSAAWEPKPAPHLVEGILAKVDPAKLGTSAPVVSESTTVFEDEGEPSPVEQELTLELELEREERLRLEAELAALRNDGGTPPADPDPAGDPSLGTAPAPADPSKKEE